MIRGRDTGLGEYMSIFERLKDLRENSSRSTGLVAALMGATFLLMILSNPRVEALHVPDVLKIVVSGMFLGFGFWPDGHAEFPQLPEGPKQAATERVGCGRGWVITFRPHRELRISTVLRFYH